MRPDYRGDLRRARILEVLSEHPLTQPELSEMVFLSRTQTYRMLAQLRSPANRKVYIAAYNTDGTNYAPIYRAGTKRDAKRPAPRSRTELRHRHKAKHPVAQRDPLLAWIPGAKS